MVIIEINNNQSIYGVLHTSKKGTNYIFNYCYTELVLSYNNYHVYSFDIWEGKIKPSDCFNFMLKLDENTNDLKVISMYSDYKKELIGKGISVAMILHVKELFNKRIISSSNKCNEIGEKRWKDATEKVWKKLVILGLAEYDQDLDIYFTL